MHSSHQTAHRSISMWPIFTRRNQRHCKSSLETYPYLHVHIRLIKERAWLTINPTSSSGNHDGSGKDAIVKLIGVICVLPYVVSSYH